MSGLFFFRRVFLSPAARATRDTRQKNALTIKTASAHRPLGVEAGKRRSLRVGHTLFQHLGFFLAENLLDVQQDQQAVL